MPINILSTKSSDHRRQIDQLLNLLRSGGLTSADETTTLDIPAIVTDILRKVREQGDGAVVELTNQLDSAQIQPGCIRVALSEIERAHCQADERFLNLMRRAIDNIREYQEHILISPPKPLTRGNRRIGVRYVPMDRVAIYVPGGKALYPSTVLMTAVPALVAGVSQIVMASPPTSGQINPMALALAKELGIQEVYQMGGAVAMAALAYGTESIAPVQKIVGPGNAFVAEAKRQLFGLVGIDSIAGPSEVLIVADDTANAVWVAADFLAQVEHNPGSAILITPSNQLAKDVAKQIEIQVAQLSRSAAIVASLEKYSSIIVVKDIDEACELANEFATEHLQINTSVNERCLEKIRHAGAIFLGANTPVPLGDYFAGPSHVLPTGGTAKFFGPLDCNDFRKASSLLEYDHESLREDAPYVIDFASREGLTAHANALEVRLTSLPERGRRDV